MDDLEQFKTNVDKMSNVRLCDVVISFQYLGIMKEEALLAMEELAKRRTAGDNFEYERYISETLASLPKIKMDIGKIIRNLKTQ